MLREGMHIHLVGIGGSGLSAIARVLLGMGYQVSGSDLVASTLTEQLTNEGARVMIGHAAENVSGADLLLISSAIPPDNPEVKVAKKTGCPIMKRAEFLRYLMDGRTSIAVAGAHGKTTTTAMLASLLLGANLDPSFIVGGVLADLGINARAGQGDHFVIEADEYDRMFLGLEPQIAVLTVVEHDHPDCYPTFEEMLDAFRHFVSQVPADGQLIACWDDPGAFQLGQEYESSGGSVCWYGFDPGATWRALPCEVRDDCDFVVLKQGDIVGSVQLGIPGLHNVLNALAVIAVADLLEIPFDLTRKVLGQFGGVGRRFEVKGDVKGILVVDDYAHHPTEIKATLAAARSAYPGRRIWVVFQPHTFSRTKVLMEEFAHSFVDADQVIVLDIYASREVDDLGVHSADLVARMEDTDARYIGDRRSVAGYLLAHLEPNDLVITLGAGDGDEVGNWVLDGLKSEAAHVQ